MKKLFTLLTLALLSIGTAWAADYVVTATRTLSNSNKTSTWTGISANDGSAFQSSQTALGEGLYFVAVGKITLNGGSSLNVKAGGEMYIEVPSATAAGTVKFTNGVNNRYMQTESGGQVHMKGDSDNGDMKAQLAFTSADIVDVDGVKYLKLTSKSDCKFQTVSITLTSGQYVTILAAPTIEVAGATGTVTITPPSGASSVKYTTDGSEPSADNGTVYSAPFDAAEGTIVKAIALGDGENYANSSIASKQVLLTGIKMATPTFVQFNGTVLLATTSPAANIYYTTDGSTPTSSSNLYKYPFTLTSNATVKAIAVREGCTDSDIASEAVSVVTNTKTKTVVMGYGSFDGGDSPTMTGKSGDDAEGFVLTASANLQSGTKTNTALGKTFIKLPTNRQFTLTMPTGWAATKITFHSFVNSNSSSTKSGWSEVAGVSYASGSNLYTDIPMGAFSDVSGYNENPDVRVYALDNATSITFTCSGDQLCVILEVDVIEAASAVVGATGWATFVTPNALDFTGLAVKAYAVTGLNGAGTAVTLSDALTEVPANTPVLLNGTAKTYGIPTIASASSIGTNKLVAGTGAAVSADGDNRYVLVNNGGTAEFQKIAETSATVPVGKAYLDLAGGGGAPILSIALNGMDVTGIDTIQKQAVSGEFYNLNGQRIAQPTKGLYIVNGKKVVIK